MSGRQTGRGRGNGAAGSSGTATFFRAEERPWLPPLVYVTMALLLGLLGPHAGASLFSGVLSPIPSTSALALLSAVASGMMALTGIVFSLVLVSLQFGSSAYGPRLARELRQQRLLPHALGIFAGTFLYAVLAIRAVDIAGFAGLSSLVIWIAFLWLLASVAALVLLVPGIHLLSMANVLAFVEQRGRRAIGFLGAHDDGDDPRGPHEGASPWSGMPVRLVIRHRGPTGYVQAFDASALVEAAGPSLLLLPHAPGDVIGDGDALAVAFGAEPLAAERVRRAVRLGRARSLEQDPAYALRLLVDIAIRALSPAINDPTTAVMALDRIESLLRLLGRARLDGGWARDGTGTLRLVYFGPGWDDLVSLALSEIQQYGRESIQVERRLGALLDDLAERVPAARRDAVERFVERRREALARASLLDEERGEAAAYDRQGLGHALGQASTL